MKKITFPIVICLLIFLLTGCKASEYKEASKLMSEGDYEQAAVAYAALGDYKDARERAAMLKVKSVSCKYEEFYENFGTLSIVNYDTELFPLEKIIDEFEELDRAEISKYPELDKYVDRISAFNEGFEEIIAIDRESLESFFGPEFFMFPSTMELSIQNSETLYRSWLQEIIALEFPYDDILK